MFNEDQAA